MSLCKLLWFQPRSAESRNPEQEELLIVADHWTMEGIAQTQILIAVDRHLLSRLEERAKIVHKLRSVLSRS